MLGSGHDRFPLIPFKCNSRRYMIALQMEGKENRATEPLNVDRIVLLHGVFTGSSLLQYEGTL
jgi:hypothetical protein